MKLVIGFSPGSMSDDVARLLAAALQEVCNIDVMIERRLGDNGIAAARAVAAAMPDGRTVFMATLGTHAIAPLLNSPAPYDPLRDFAPIALLTQSPMLLACHPSLGIRSVADLIARASANDDQLTYATSAIGGAPHLAAELFMSLTGTRMRHVRYDETEKLYADLEAGRVALSFNNIASMLPRCRRGALIALGLSSAQRSTAAPDIPAIAEAGVAGYEMSNWTGLVAPPATPRHLIERLNAAVNAAIGSTQVVTSLAAQGIAPRGGSPELLSQFMADERTRWAPVVARLKQAVD
jgi:tripartite-type tricarboxylate transporter receptor subunit TctC